ncbi:hypothetical protein L2E82_02615 [Cichorium intybus]|uniref:Uncharacterized protein n=1 Tax=Cichorium intybus TaxID=13427 RepID=A0ACB9H3A4_CICIN|nr:hypothetical protein L2E82_02615 [Cichorium intybus]
MTTSLRMPRIWAAIHTKSPMEFGSKRGFRFNQSPKIVCVCLCGGGGITMPPLNFLLSLSSKSHYYSNLNLH